MSVETGYIKGRLKELRALHKGHLHGMDDVLSNMEKEVDIFIDLIPGYKIQKKQEDEDKAVHAKTTRVVIDIEDEILSKYEKFLNYLLKMRKATVQTLQTQAYECITKLLSSASHFNFASSLISACVSGINEKNEAAARMCVEAIEELLDNDASGECSLKVLELTINQVKAKMQTLNPALIAALIRLRISAVDVERKTHEQRKRERDLKKPMNNDDKLIQRSLDKADATPDQAHRKRTMTYVLQRLMAAYLRVLEAAQDANGIRQHRLLVPVLEGLTKFAPLLDIRMLNLLLTAIKDVLELSNTHALTTLNAIVACATLTECAEMASVQTNTAGDEFTSSAVAVDFGPAYKHLYRIIPEILSTPHAADLVSFRRERAQTIKRAEKMEQLKASGDDDTKSLATSMATTVDLSHEYINACAERNRRVTLLLKACDILLMRPKFITVNRVTAFAKRLSLYSAHQPPHIAMALMGFIRQLSQKRSYLADLISESPEDNAGNAEYNPNAQEPEFAQADGAIMWEWCLLTKSYHPTLSRYTLAVQKMAQEVRDPLMKRPASLTHAVMEGLGPMLRSDGGELLRSHDVSLGAFTPEIQEPKAKKRRTLPT